MSYSTDYFDEPDKFIPERWNKSKEDSIHPFVSLPFGFGQRGCYGNVITCILYPLLTSSIIHRASSSWAGDIHPPHQAHPQIHPLHWPRLHCSVSGNSPQTKRTRPHHYQGEITVTVIIMMHVFCEHILHNYYELCRWMWGRGWLRSWDRSGFELNFSISLAYSVIV